ncbi:cytochrome P450 [Laetiporus sulphureus 93-53]|uniref:Cytochrome P450 n=1 Tax=Laetiporus sulphureus 93-53 TaxID=1314785 RepID=A0A165BBM2_9APHY|nr:cytochrome P450 [Laetiporus sulphureus 93-53]KZT00685.1 cytochrome P450 [Laetiporus sulphureus 93-53]
MVSAAIRLLVGLSGLFFSYVLIHHLRRRARTTPLVGPPSTNFLLGLGRLVSKSPDPSLLYEQWAEKYGPVYNVPAALNISRVILCDPRAVNFVFARGTYGFVKPRVDRVAIELTVGRGIMHADCDEHKRQRKGLIPAFANASIRNLTPVFYDAAYQVKNAWDGIIEAQSGGSAVIEVQTWMNRISLDTLGIAGFTHDFGTLKGKHSSIAECFDALTGARTDFDLLMAMVGLAFPTIVRVPSPLLRLFKKLDATIEEIATRLLDSSRKEKVGGAAEDKSIVGLLLKSESSKSALRMSQEEIVSQMKVLIFAGYVTSSIMLTWCLIELSKKTEVQQKLRDELAQYTSADPTWEQLTHALPYLDAVVQETVRLHPQVKEHTAVATEDTIIPLSAPMRTASGQVVTIPIHYMNMAGVLWGSDAREFRPERWVEAGGIPPRAQEIQGHRHVLTFIDGPRMCLGRGFAFAQMKAVLSVLIKNFAFELRDGWETRIEVILGVNERPRVAGEEGVRVPLRVRRLE